MTLTVHNAEIRTAKVEVKTLTLAGKQVTLAVFRQLRDRELVNEDGRLNGQPWGVVNYHPDKCADAASHLHVVWQHGTDLFRARVESQVNWPRHFTAMHGRGYVRAQVRDACRSGSTSPYVGDSVMVKDFLGVPVQIDPGPEVGHALVCRRLLDKYVETMSRLGPDTRTDFLAFKGRGRPATLVVSLSAAVRAAWFNLDEALATLGDEPLPLAETCLLEEVRVEADLRRRHREVRKALSDLPQLFIAV